MINKIWFFLDGGCRVELYNKKMQIKWYIIIIIDDLKKY
jgi:hypothetical protein